MRIALSIAASDPTGGAGLQADLQVFRRMGVHGAGVVTALTIQDTERVHSVLPVFPSVVLEQLRTLLADLRPHAIKIGALASDDVVRNVILGLASVPDDVPKVLDPILFSSSGTPLLERRAWGALQELMGQCAVVTPNLPEAEALSGCDVSDRSGTEAAARYFVEELGAGAALVKGGHREGSVADLLAARDESGVLRYTWLEGERIDVGRVHGTGCALSSALSAGLALGESLPDAVAAARNLVAAAIASAAVASAAGDGSGSEGEENRARFLVYE
jgi:hydroxymethylpyrimidine/phosphomethylpyrimidine kinase